VLAETAGVVPVAGLPMSAVAAETVTVPMTVHGKMMVMPVVMSMMTIVMGVVMKAMVKMCKAVPEETVTNLVTVAPTSWAMASPCAKATNKKVEVVASDLVETIVSIRGQ
jgi:hypothetical protein